MMMMIGEPLCWHSTKCSSLDGRADDTNEEDYYSGRLERLGFFLMDINSIHDMFLHKLAFLLHYNWEVLQIKQVELFQSKDDVYALKQVIQ